MLLIAFGNFSSRRSQLNMFMSTITLPSQAMSMSLSTCVWNIISTSRSRRSAKRSLHPRSFQTSMYDGCLSLCLKFAFEQLKLLCLGNDFFTLQLRSKNMLVGCTLLFAGYSFTFTD